MPVQLITDHADLQQKITKLRQAGKTIGLVPTMGALHAGHLSLVEAARRECDVVITTIFVNPTQFASGEDLEKYPRTLKRDMNLLAQVSCGEMLVAERHDFVFAPSVEQIYRPEHETYVAVGPIGSTFEGEIRPEHFRGVATVVLKLFNLVPADRAYFGQKDYQQTLVVQQMVADFNLPIKVVVCPIVREADGLAMSSRNVYLSPSERQSALALSQSLLLAENKYKAGEKDIAILREFLKNKLLKAGVTEIQYIAFLKSKTMTPVSEMAGEVVLCLAVKVGKTRLIDNWIIK